MASRQLWLVHRWRTVLVVVVVLPAMLFGGGLAWYRVVYDSVAFWSVPPRITYCDRDYQAGGATLSREQIEAVPVSLPGNQQYQLSEIGRIVPVLGWPLWANLTPDDRRTGLGVPCTMVIYLQGESDAFVPYSLLGGP